MDELYEEIKELIKSHQEYEEENNKFRINTGFLRRRFRIGQNRAEKYIAMLKADGFKVEEGQPWM